MPQFKIPFANMPRPKIPFAKILRIRIPSAKVVIAKTKDVASSTKVWVRTGAAINKGLMTGWNWSEVIATLTLHMNRNPHFRYAIYSIVIYVLGVISVYSVALATGSYYLGSRRKCCTSLRAEIVRVTGRLREADGRLHEADGRQVKAQAMICYLLERVSEESAAAAAAAGAEAWVVAVNEKQGGAVMAGMEDACPGGGTWVTSDTDNNFGRVRVPPPQRVGSSCCNRFGGGRREVGRKVNETVAGVEDAGLVAREGTPGTITDTDCALEHLSSPWKVTTGRCGEDRREDNADAGTLFARARDRTVEPATTTAVRESTVRRSTRSSAERRLEENVFSSCCCCCCCCQEGVRHNLENRRLLAESRQT